MSVPRLSWRFRIPMILAGFALFAVLWLPFWRIELNAPQYPEGLVLQIYANRIGGNVDIVNGLNHYIGMKTLHTEDFVEFSILPWLVGLFAVFALLAGISGTKKWLYAFTVSLIVFGVIALTDFWKWEYDYGHHLNPDAAIVVPGMAYQPPLIGFKQLLNFGAYSVPDLGGWIFAAVGALALTCSLLIWWKNRNKIVHLPVIIVCIVMTAIQSCSNSVSVIRQGTDHCDFCRMSISELSYSAAVLTTKGRTYKFDDLHCLSSFLSSGQILQSSVKERYVADYYHPERLIKTSAAVFFQSKDIKAPMGGNIIAIPAGDVQALQKLTAAFQGGPVQWNTLVMK